MSTISTFKDSNYFYININTNKPISIIKYDLGVRDSYYFINNGKEIFIKNKNDKIFKIDLDSLKDGIYTIAIYYEGGSYEITNFNVSFLVDIKLNESKSSIIFTDYAPFGRDKIINSLTKFVPIISSIKDDEDIKALFSLSNHIGQKDIYRYISNINRINNISFDNKLINMNLSFNISNPSYIYGLLILNSSSNPIIVIKFIEEILAEKDTININIKFPLI